MLIPDRRKIRQPALGLNDLEIKIRDPKSDHEVHLELCKLHAQTRVSAHAPADESIIPRAVGIIRALDVSGFGAVFVDVAAGVEFRWVWIHGGVEMDVVDGVAGEPAGRDDFFVVEGDRVRG